MGPPPATESSPASRCGDDERAVPGVEPPDPHESETRGAVWVPAPGRRQRDSAESGTPSFLGRRLSGGTLSARESDRVRDYQKNVAQPERVPTPGTGASRCRRSRSSRHRTTSRGQRSRGCGRWTQQFWSSSLSSRPGRPPTTSGGSTAQSAPTGGHPLENVALVGAAVVSSSKRGRRVAQTGSRRLTFAATRPTVW